MTVCSYDEGKYEAGCNFEAFVVTGHLLTLARWLVFDLLEAVRILNILF
jgi:hypothetical protein